MRRAGAITSALVAGNTIHDDRAFPFFSFCRAVRSAKADSALARPPAPYPLELAKVEPFVDPLPMPAVAVASGSRADPEGSGAMLPYYRIAMREMNVQVHRDLKPTRMWGYGSACPGPMLEVRKDQAILVEWVNELPAKHFLPIDPRLHGAPGGQPEVRTVVHLHGAKVPPGSDGYPEHWFIPGGSKLYRYPNRQDAMLLWYHDHAMGINRLNVYAGLLGLYVIRDEAEEALDLPKGKYEIPLAIYDRMLAADGQLIYPVSSNPNAAWVSEVYADTTLVNGKLFPFLEVEPRPYRLRVLNASNSRIYQLALSNGRPFQQIGADQGLLPAPIAVERLPLAPGERADLIVDFSRRAGERMILANGAADLMEIRVAARPPRGASPLPAALRSVARIPESEAVATRVMTLDESEDLVGNPITVLLNGTGWDTPVTEKPVIGTTEIWAFVNLTDDPHPIHLHTVRFQILDRRRLDVPDYQRSGQLRYTGRALPPEPGEAGWKDTVRADAGMVTRIIARFEGYTGRYVWHCHVLEHEDNDMMRPFEIVERA